MTFVSSRFGLACGGVALLAAVSAAFAGEAEKVKPGPLWVFVGTYTAGKSKGIYRFEMDPATGRLSGGELAAEAVNPSFLAVHPSRRFLFAVSEVENAGGKKTGTVRSFALDARTGKLTPLNEQPSGGAGPCHVVTDRAGRHVLVANYGGGSAAVLPVDESGRLGEATGFAQHEGSGTNPGRQEGPHAHSINVDPANRFAAVADLGLDKVFVYRFDGRKGTLTLNDPPSVSLDPGAGPRHLAFHPTAPYAYVINEIANTVTAMHWDADRGVLTPVQSVPTLPEGFKGQSWTAEVQVHPSGKFLYGSNRGHDSIVAFTIDPATGKLTHVAHQGAGIKTPRNFGIDPSGTFLVVANQGSDSLVVFRNDPKSGELRPAGGRVEVAQPVCVKFVPKES
jgi:6-phosphogluconolactonase